MKRVRTILIVVMLLVFILTGVWWAVSSRFSPTSPDIQTSGFIEAKDFAIAAEVGGRIGNITVDEGDTVNAGAILVKLDDSLLLAQQQQATVAVEQAQAAVAQTQAVVEQMQAALDQVMKARDQAAVTREGAKIVWENALEVQRNPLEVDARLTAAQAEFDAAGYSLELAIDSFRKIAYPYTYSTFALDVPSALGSIEDARRRISDIKSALQAGLPADQVATILQQALDDLANAFQQLARGQGEDVFASGLIAAKDFWTLRAAQIQMAQAQSALVSANQTIQIMRAIKKNPQDINAAVDSTRASYDTASAALDVAERAVGVAQRQVTVAQRQVIVAQKQVEFARTALEIVKVQLGKTTIVSPVAGVVAARNAEIGEVAQAGAAVLTVTQLDSVTLTAYVPESRIGLVKLGQQALVAVDSYPGETFSGDVTFISPRALFTPGNVQLKEEREKTVFAVKISLVNTDRKLKPGMSADAQIITGR